MRRISYVLDALTHLLVGGQMTNFCCNQPMRVREKAEFQFLPFTVKCTVCGRWWDVTERQAMIYGAKGKSKNWSLATMHEFTTREN